MKSADQKVQELYNVLRLVRMNLSPGGYRSLQRQALVDNTEMALRLIDAAISEIEPS